MTLTSLLPTLRRILPDPIREAVWPEHTHATTTDVVVAGISLLRLVELCQTPCVHTGDAAISGAHTRSALRRDRAVVVVRVTAVLKNWDAAPVVLIDACLDTVPAVWSETRLIGRTSTAKATTAIVLGGDSHQTSCTERGVVALPADLREGDLLAIPCTGMVTLRDLRPQQHARNNAPGPDRLDPSMLS